MFQNIPSPSIIYDLKLFLLVKKQSYLDKFFIIEHIEHMTSVTSNVFIKFLSFFFFNPGLFGLVFSILGSFLKTILKFKSYDYK